MAEVTYTSVTWTAGDTITEAKLDNMVANDRAVDAMANGVEFTERSDPSTPGSNKIHLYAKDKSGIPTLYAINDAGTVYELSEGRPTFGFSYNANIEVGSNQAPPLTVHRNLTAVKWYISANTAPTGANAIFDINKNGTSLWASTPADRPTLTAGNLSDTGTDFDTTSLLEGDVLSFDIDQIGSSVAGAQVTVQIRCK